jgi:hypothetical protein
MRWLLLFSLVNSCWPALGQQSVPQLRPVVQFQVHGLSRLAALENLGFATGTSLLIEGGDIKFLQQPITMTAHRDTVAGVIHTILHGKENYKIHRRGALLILRPAAPSRPPNRILKLRMTDFSFTGNSISSLSPLIGFYLREATGCDPQGYAYVGPPMSLDIPPIHLKSASFQDIVERVASASQPTMWIVKPDTGERGCISNPHDLWQVILYGGRLGFHKENGQQRPFRESTGPQLVP